MAFDDSVKLIWSLTGAGPGTTLTASGNSGGYTPSTPNNRTAVDLRRVDDMWLSVIGTTSAGTNLQAQVNFYDDQGNLFQLSGVSTPLFATAALSATGRAVAFAGRHGAAGGSYLVASEWAQVAWSVTGTWTGVEIALYGR
jgi:hypothetical protein